MSRDRLSLEKKTRFQNLILEDEQVLSLIVVAAHPQGSYNELEKPLLPSTKLHTTTFASIAHMTLGPNAKIDIVGVVLRCGSSKYIGRTQNRCREVTIADDQRNQFLLTLWDDLGEIEGTKLEALMENGKDFHVILGRNIGVSGYQETIFNSTISINPTYPQALQLISWAKTNKNVLSGNVSANIAGSSTAFIVNLVHRQVISIAEEERELTHKCNTNINTMEHNSNIDPT
ncbi:hypothetical protein KY290_031405 [Solanum tuberosum]|uniref:Replication protein A OB domain-containing protein n=1 Tax=Solanum tuberosum TaxID=4113 RepID=A0ABQ7U925_SOLTU|nr:hypothetical protein KY289_030797 [Solanum tuberosum]KAH0743412.1 hypothetical protein KY290_031405 [Solanum tuberosum]